METVLCNRVRSVVGRSNVKKHRDSNFQAKCNALHLALYYRRVCVCGSVCVCVCVCVYAAFVDARKTV